MRKIVTWIVIADGQHARIVAHDGPGKGVRQVTCGSSEGDARHAREIMADRPGTRIDSAGDNRHGMARGSDPRQLIEDAFLSDLIDQLVAGEANGEFDRLVLVAEPRALGTLRKKLPRALMHRLHAELNKDLTHVPFAKLPSHLDSILPI